MKIEEIVKVLEAQILYIPDGYDVDISTAGASDLLSDVLAYVAEDILLITGLLSPQVIRTANLMDISAVVFVRGKVPSQEIIDEANKPDSIIKRENIIEIDPDEISHKKEVVTSDSKIQEQFKNDQQKIFDPPVVVRSVCIDHGFALKGRLD